MSLIYPLPDNFIISKLNQEEEDTWASVEVHSDVEEAAGLHHVVKGYIARVAGEHCAIESLTHLDGSEYGDQALIDIIQNVTKAITYKNSYLWLFRVPVSCRLNILNIFLIAIDSQARPNLSYLALNSFWSTNTLQDGFKKCLV